MESNIKQRLSEFLIYKKIGQRTFERMAKLSNGYINNIKSSIGSDKLQNILYVFPELNILWLLTGEGDMLKSTKEVEKVEESNVEYGKNIDYKDKYYELLDKYYQLNEENRQLRREPSQKKKRVAPSVQDVNA